MNGTLHKTEQGWIVRWSDLHSFLHGWHWMDTPIYPQDSPELVEDKQVEFEHIIDGYDEKSFAPFSHAKIINKL